VAYKTVRSATIRLLALPEGPPEPPPGGAVVRTFNASRKYLHYRLLGPMLGAAILFLVGIGLAVGSLAEGILLLAAAVAVMAGAILVAIVGYIANRLEYDLRYYILTDRSLRIREGVFFLRESTLTFANVQNLRIRKGPIQQLFGIADVLVDTAGGASGGKDPEGNAMQKGHRGTIQGIENPTEVRDLVLGLLKKYRDAGLGDPDDAHPAAATDDSAQERLREILAEVKGLRAVLTR
jgi:membrane protein YdbS with pleckstrin-like domain